MTTRMKRTTVFFSAQQEAALNKEAKKLGVSAAEVLRRLVDEGLLQRNYFERVVMKSDPVLQRLKLAKQVKPLSGVRLARRK